MTTAEPAFSFQVSMDCHDTAVMTRFWSLALNYVAQPPPPGFADWDAFADEYGIPVEERSGFGSVVDPAGEGPRLFFHAVPEDKVVKNRVHLDVNVGRRLEDDERAAAVRAHAERLVAAGAAIVAERWDAGSRWTVMTDPEGNEFCLQ
ncbi:hypothetical protein M6D93_09165 [Jatrophihabitans telluris]|uniref:Glyoxalase-like domain-containing protein n=1 Tax=Jatrophihabitans telluris TaxID=2038343 RepID=A0ABY4R5N3_9ACTN|nr:VOC family protein [Jatrophihabitans telluris]UQX90150.1 hypothetical protein M6D93_09165 [Jatrophihabitans telluris]